MRYFFITLITILFLTSCSVKDFNYMEKNVNKEKIITKVNEKQYLKEVTFQWKIIPGDRIEIHAYNQSSSSSSGQLKQLLSTGGTQYTQRQGDEGILIKEDGLVKLPLVGNVRVVGLTEDEASQLIMEKYKRYLKQPFVSVQILNQNIFVIGEVEEPGPVLVTNGTMTLFQALAYSGDLTDYADRTNIRIIRGSMRDPEIREIDITDFDSIKFTSLVLRPNDIVYISGRDSQANVVGINEKLPFWNLVSGIMSPFLAIGLILGVTGN